MLLSLDIEQLWLYSYFVNFNCLYFSIKKNIVKKKYYVKNTILNFYLEVV